MFVTLETIKKIRNRNLKSRVSSPSFMVSEKQSWLHPKFYNCGRIGSFLVNQGLVFSNESRNSLKWLIQQGFPDSQWASYRPVYAEDVSSWKSNTLIYMFRCCVPNCKKSEECGFHQFVSDMTGQGRWSEVFRPGCKSVRTDLLKLSTWKLLKSLLI